MRVVKKATTPAGVLIQVEDWREDYPALNLIMIAAYPVSLYTFPGDFAPTVGKPFRTGFCFRAMDDADSVFSDLESGKKKLADIVDRMDRREYKRAITG